MGIWGGCRAQSGTAHRRLVSPDTDTLPGRDGVARRVSCPECRAEMEPGFLVAESYLGGDALAHPDGLGNMYLAGLRCPRCRFLALHY